MTTAPYISSLAINLTTATAGLLDSHHSTQVPVVTSFCTQSKKALSDTALDASKRDMRHMRDVPGQIIHLVLGTGEESNNTAAFVPRLSQHFSLHHNSN
jgi:hypothetical protein